MVLKYHMAEARAGWFSWKQIWFDWNQQNFNSIWFTTVASLGLRPFMNCGLHRQMSSQNY